MQHIAAAGYDLIHLRPRLAMGLDHPGWHSRQRPHGGHLQKVGGREFQLDDQCVVGRRADADGLVKRSQLGFLGCLTALQSGQAALN